MRSVTRINIYLAFVEAETKAENFSKLFNERLQNQMLEKQLLSILILTWLEAMLCWASPSQRATSNLGKMCSVIKKKSQIWMIVDLRAKKNFKK